VAASAGRSRRGDRGGDAGRHLDGRWSTDGSHDPPPPVSLARGDIPLGVRILPMLRDDGRP